MWCADAPAKSIFKKMGLAWVLKARGVQLALTRWLSAPSEFKFWHVHGTSVAVAIGVAIVAVILVVDLVVVVVVVPFLSLLLIVVCVTSDMDIEAVCRSSRK